MNLFAIKELDEIVFTTITGSPEETIAEFLETEQICNTLANWGREKRGEPQKPAPEWLNENQKVVKVKIIEVNE